VEPRRATTGGVGSRSEVLRFSINCTFGLSSDQGKYHSEFAFVCTSCE
jgi:hypothetical protein